MEKSPGIQLKNPVYQEYFADPFAFEFEGMYYAIGTGDSEADGTAGERLFPMLKSANLMDWQPLGRVLYRPPPGLGNNFWAPEVAYHQGVFFLYYSVGWGDKNHQLRVAVSTTPAGPYRDEGLTLVDPTECSFAIDPHPFRDADGQWYLFYARDFLECQGAERPGTALMAAKLKTMRALEGPGTCVLRARSDWQRFQANRPMYGRVFDWHTLEGPCVRLHQGKYFCFYSGGRWENESYGVDYGVADSLLGPYSDTGNESGPRVLRTLPGKVIGPGHNSIVTGPNGADYLVYHAWDRGMTARRMCIDRLLWTEYGPVCSGPTVLPS